MFLYLHQDLVLAPFSFYFLSAFSFSYYLFFVLRSLTSSLSFSSCEVVISFVVSSDRRGIGGDAGGAEDGASFFPQRVVAGAGYRAGTFRL